MADLNDPTRPVLVKWIDAHRCENEWIVLDGDWKPTDSMEIYSAGYVVHMNEKSITVAGHVGTGADDEPSQFIGAVTIPRVAVLSVERLAPETRSRQKAV